MLLLVCPTATAAFWLRRFDESGLLEHLFDDTIKRAMAGGQVSRHVSADGTLVRANASLKSFVPIEVALDPAEYKRRLRAQDRATEDGPPDPGNRAVDFRGEKRGNATHRSVTDPDCRFVSKGTSGTDAYPGYTVNALMENRHRFLLGFGVEIFQGPTSEKTGCLTLLARAKRRLRFRPATLGADKGFFHENASRRCSPCRSCTCMDWPRAILISRCGGCSGRRRRCRRPRSRGWKASWHAEYESWKHRRLDDFEPVYVWADGIYVTVGRPRN